MNQPRRQRVLLISRNSGTAWWRVSQPLAFLRDLKICDLEWLSPEDVPTRDRLFLESFDTFVFHQCWDDHTWGLALLAKNLGRRIICSCDDLIVGHQIPKFIKGGLPYNDSTIMRNVHDFFNLADKVIVTTPILAEQLGKFYEVPESRFLVFPNLPSYDWFGRWFNAKERVRQFAQTKRKGVKFRVGIISSLTHYDLEDSPCESNKEPDDLQIVLDAIAELGGNAKNFQFVMTTNENERLRARFPKDIDLEMKPMVPIRQYPAAIAGLNLHAVIVPLQDNLFSNCKSDIKNTETAALGIPTLFQDTTPYKHCTDDWFRCATPKDFASRLLSIRDWGETRYEETITKNYNRTFNQPIDYFGQKLNGYWLEGNLNIVGDAFLSFSPPVNKDGIVAPAIKTTKEVEDGKTQV